MAYATGKTIPLFLASVTRTGKARTVTKVGLVDLSTGLGLWYGRYWLINEQAWV